VELAENAAQARNARAAARPDLVLLDIWMPDTDGVTLLKEWASTGLLNMPVIMMSGHATIETAVQATRIGALAFLEKPITMQKLLKAVDGLQGVALARASLPDVILMDINLPDISGIDALKALREDVSTAHIPVVAISANAMSRDIEVGRQLGFFRYLTKPIVVEEFMTTLDLALDWNQKNTGSPKSPEKS
jgi:DNA-binding NtrC family response regulator